MTFKSFIKCFKLRSMKIRLNTLFVKSAALLTMILTRTSIVKRERRNILDTYALLWLVARVDNIMI